jgi:hypothetical protein
MKLVLGTGRGLTQERGDSNVSRHRKHSPTKKQRAMNNVIVISASRLGVTKACIGKRLLVWARPGRGEDAAQRRSWSGGAASKNGKSHGARLMPSMFPGMFCCSRGDSPAIHKSSRPMGMAVGSAKAAVVNPRIGIAQEGLAKAGSRGVEHDLI